MARDDAAERSQAGPGNIALPPQDPTYVTVNDEDGETDGFLAHWREDEWLYADVDATHYFNWTDDHE